MADQSNEMGMVAKVAAAQFKVFSAGRLLENYPDHAPIWNDIARAGIEAMTEPAPNMLEDMRHEIATTMGITLPDYALIAAWKMAVLAALSHDEAKG